MARSFWLLSFICCEYQVINDYSDTSNDESRSTGVTNPREAFHPWSNFRRSHDALGTVSNVITIDGQSRGVGGEGGPRGVSNYTKRGEIGASGDGKLMEPRDSHRALLLSKSSTSFKELASIRV